MKVTWMPVLAQLFVAFNEALGRAGARKRRPDQVARKNETDSTRTLDSSGRKLDEEGRGGLLPLHLRQATILLPGASPISPPGADRPGLSEAVEQQQEATV